MADSATLLVDDVLPHQPMRQWVLSVPFPLRFLLVCSEILIRSKQRFEVVAPLNYVDGNIAWTESFSPGHWCKSNTGVYDELSVCSC